MKTNALILAIAAVMLAAVAAPRVVALANPIRDLRNVAVVCGATGDPEVIQPAGSASSMCIQNSSATCVRLGGESVTTATGLSIGDACPGGKVFCADMTRAWCESEAGDITVQVIYGSN